MVTSSAPPSTWCAASTTRGPRPRGDAQPVTIRGDLYDRPPLDAEALGAALAGAHDPELVLALYSDVRTHRAKTLVAQSRRLLRLSAA